MREGIYCQKRIDLIHHKRNHPGIVHEVQPWMVLLLGWAENSHLSSKIT